LQKIFKRRPATDAFFIWDGETSNMNFAAIGERARPGRYFPRPRGKFARIENIQEFGVVSHANR
jgi:hypothetical protein